MALINCKNFISSVFNKLATKQSILDVQRMIVPQYQPACNEWTDARMRKDVRKRKCVSEQWPLKSRLLALKKNKILPPELRDLASEAIMNLPSDAIGNKIVWRCALTSRPRGTVYRWRVSRIVFRHLADYNKLGGIMRARW